MLVKILKHPFHRFLRGALRHGPRRQQAVAVPHEPAHLLQGALRKVLFLKGRIDAVCHVLQRIEDRPVHIK